MNEWIWIIIWVVIISGLVLFAQFQSKVDDFISSAPGDLSFGSAIINHKGTVYVSSPMLSNESGAVFKIENLEKKTAEFGDVGQRFGISMFSDGYTRTIVSTGNITRNKRNSKGAVTFSGSYNGEVSGFPQSPSAAITLKDQMFVVVGTSIYVYQHLTRTSHYLSYIFEARPLSFDGFISRICWRTDNTCTVLDRLDGKETWKKTYEFTTQADQLAVSSNIIYGVNNGVFYKHSLSIDGTIVILSLGTEVVGTSKLAWDSSRSNFFIAVDDGQAIRIFRYQATDNSFDYSGTCYETGLTDFIVVTSTKVIVSASNNIFAVNLSLMNSKFSQASQLK